MQCDIQATRNKSRPTQSGLISNTTDVNGFNMREKKNTFCSLDLRVVIPLFSKFQSEEAYLAYRCEVCCLQKAFPFSHYIYFFCSDTILHPTNTHI